MIAGSTCTAARHMVAAHFGVSADALLERNRTRHIVVPRQAAIYVARRLNAGLAVPLSYPVIARHFGHADHTTAIHAIHATELRALQDERFARILADLTQQADRIVEQMRAHKIKDLPPRIPADVVCDIAGYGRATLATRIREGKMPAPIDRARSHIFETEAILVALGLKKPESETPTQASW